MTYVIAVFLLLAYGAFMRSMYEINTFEINRIGIVHRLASQRQPVFVYFADLHGTAYGSGNYKLLSKIDEINPDAIIIGGDMIVGKKKFSCTSKETTTAIELLNRLCEKYPVYYGFGNHETRTKNSDKNHIEFKTYIHEIKHPNLHILCNQHEYVTIKGTRFCIYGLEADNSYYSKKKIKTITAEYIKSCLGDSPENKHSISLVISHNPDAFEACAQWGAEYVLSGHNHGGFIRLPLIGGLIASNYRLFPKYTGGIYKSNLSSSKMLLTRGLGSHSINFRLFNKPEVMIIKFKAENNL